MLRDIACDVFSERIQVNSEEADIESESNSKCNTDEAQQLIIPDDEDDSLVILSAESLNISEPNLAEANDEIEKRYSTLYNDIFFRPNELETVYAWDIFRNYVKEKLPKSKTQQKTFLRFKPGHPQYTTHCLKKLNVTAVPVLMGYRVPRNDLKADEVKYAVAMLTLFKPWSNVRTSPLKPKTVTWKDAFRQWKSAMPPEHIQVTCNMQLLYQTKDVKFDFSAKHRQRLKELTAIGKHSGFDIGEDSVDNVYNPIWENAMQTTIDPNDLDEIVVPQIAVMRQSSFINELAKKVGFYLVRSEPTPTTRSQFENCTRLGSEDDVVHADIENLRLMKEKNALVTARLRASEQRSSNAQCSMDDCSPSETIPHALRTTLNQEADNAQLIYERLYRTRASTGCTSDQASSWSSLHPYQQLCFILVIKHNLNDEQTRAFLLLADKIGREIEHGVKSLPLTLLCTGPGGTGKSVTFHAWKEFYNLTGHPE
jgi:hypothetical protein